MKNRFALRELLPIASIGLMGGAIDLPLVISFAFLIYSGELAPFVNVGIGLILLGSLIMQTVVALTTSVPGMIGAPQEIPVAILSLAALSLVARMQAAPVEAKFITVAMTVILASIVSGILFIFLGGFKLSRFVRFIPYPVVGGFVAGSGLLLIQGALGVMTDFTPNMDNAVNLFSHDHLWLWLPGVLFGAVVLIVSRRIKHFLTYPALLIGVVVVFYLAVWISGYNLSEVRAMGWLLGPFPQGSLWKPIDLVWFAKVNWNLIASQATDIAAVALVSLIALLLNASALELVAQKDIDLDRELISTGIANIAGGLAGSPVGYHLLGGSSLALRMGISSRLVALFAASVSGLTLLFGASLLSFVPKIMVGGLIFFVGLSFLAEWLYDAWFHLPHVDYALIWAILIVVGAIGFLEGVGVGIAIAIVIFVVNYSRIGIVKDTLTGMSYQSNVERPFEHRQLIKRLGERILILRLQGSIFFGTSPSLVNQVNARIKGNAKEKLRFLILDFQNVTALDASAIFSFVRLKQMASSNCFYLVLTGISNDIEAKLAHQGIDKSEAMLRIFPTLDYGMEWCESKLLVDEGSSTIIRSGTLSGQLKRLLPSNEKVDKFMSYLEKKEAQPDQVLINQGEMPDCMYFIDSGEVTMHLEMLKGNYLRLKSQRGGTMVGEMGLVLKHSRTATVIVSEPSVLYRLSLDSYNRMMREDPELAFYLYQWISRVLSSRIAENNATLEVLLG